MGFSQKTHTIIKKSKNCGWLPMIDSSNHNQFITLSIYLCMKWIFIFLCFWESLGLIQTAQSLINYTFHNNLWYSSSHTLCWVQPKNSWYECWVGNHLTMVEICSGSVIRVWAQLFLQYGPMEAGSSRGISSFCRYILLAVTVSVSASSSWVATQ